MRHALNRLNLTRPSAVSASSRLSKRIQYKLLQLTQFYMIALTQPEWLPYFSMLLLAQCATGVRARNDNIILFGAQKLFGNETAQVMFGCDKNYFYCPSPADISCGLLTCHATSSPNHDPDTTGALLLCESTATGCTYDGARRRDIVTR